jgi:transcriptional pleiotropic regulator of transition state genes
MKSTGIVRRMDALGRIVIPIETRQILDLAEDDLLELHEEAGKVILSKHMSSACIFCGRDDNLVQFKGRAVCRRCMIAAENIVSP